VLWSVLGSSRDSKVPPSLACHPTAVVVYQPAANLLIHALCLALHRLLAAPQVDRLASGLAHEKSVVVVKLRADMMPHLSFAKDVLKVRAGGLNAYIVIDGSNASPGK